jgi:hypothetical protein
MSSLYGNRAASVTSACGDATTTDRRGARSAIETYIFIFGMESFRKEVLTDATKQRKMQAKKCKNKTRVSGIRRDAVINISVGASQKNADSQLFPARARPAIFISTKPGVLQFPSRIFTNISHHI